MNAILRLLTTIVAYGDVNPNSNPKFKFVDWSRDIASVRVSSPKAEGYVIAPGASQLIFDGTRALTIDNTTAMKVSLVPGTTDHYRFAVTSGTPAGFRADRLLNLVGGTVSVAVNANGSATFTITAGAVNFNNVQVGDVFYVPPASEITTQPFNPANTGFWTVLARTSSVLTVTRPGSDFEAANETGISVSATNQTQAFSSSGVQVGDQLQVVSAFVPSTQRTYPVVGVTPSYLEVTSSQALAAETGIVPTATGLVVYTSAKRFLHIECDQECVVRANGDTGDFQRVSPFTAGDMRSAGSYERTGPTWSLTLVNKGPLPMNAVVIGAE